VSEERIARIVVALPAGGFGYRMRGAGDGPTQKCLLPLPNGETLIGRLVREYAAGGFRRFVALVNHEGEAVRQHLDKGRPWGVDADCSFDPDPEGSGRTGALAHARQQGLLPTGAEVLVHNADCQLMRYPGSFGRDLAAAHAAAAREGAAATLVAVAGTPYPYTGMSIEDGLVTGIEMYPFIPVPTHAGITLLSPEALDELIALAPPGKSNFERDMFPRWSDRGALAALVLTQEQWIPVDDRKAYRQFCDYVAEDQRS
jgi:NDP-sugar pyrophosphorylase family protein